MSSQRSGPPPSARYMNDFHTRVTSHSSRNAHIPGYQSPKSNGNIADAYERFPTAPQSYMHGYVGAFPQYVNRYPNAANPFYARPPPAPVDPYYYPTARPHTEEKGGLQGYYTRREDDAPRRSRATKQEVDKTWKGPDIKRPVWVPMSDSHGFANFKHENFSRLLAYEKQRALTVHLAD
jgi:hypothetical protein